MKNILTIMSKEFSRFFTDRRMIMMALMPAVLIFAVYSFMGSIMEGVFAPGQDYTPTVCAVNAPDFILRSANDFGLSVLRTDAGEAAARKEMIGEKAGKTDVLMVFPPDFDTLVEAYDARGAMQAPNIEIYYNSTVPTSQQTYYTIVSILDDYESSLANKFDVNRDVEDADLATKEDRSATFISMLMPMLLMISLYSGSMGLALESITGEKERGTLATLLVSPLKRSELAIGKILSLAALSFLSGVTTALATILSLPKLMGGAGAIDAGIYSMTDYMMLALVILSVLLLMVAMLSIVSAFSKSVKEAGQAATPLMILVMVVGVSGMFGSAPASPAYYTIPFYGSVQSMNGIFSRDYNAANIAIACLSSSLYAGLGGFALTKMMGSEKVMFSR